MAQRPASRRRTHLIERGDIFLVDFDPTIGHEQRGRRPAIVVTPAAFNQLGLQLVAPITSGGAFARNRGFAVELTETKTAGIILCNQLRTIDLAARKRWWISWLQFQVRAASPARLPKSPASRLVDTPPPRHRRR